MTHFRKHLTEVLAELNELVTTEGAKEAPDDEDRNGKNGGGNESVPRPASREAKPNSKKLFGEQVEPVIGQKAKPLTYRESVRKQYLTVSKKRKPGPKTIRKTIRRQLTKPRNHYLASKNAAVHAAQPQSVTRFARTVPLAALDVQRAVPLSQRPQREHLSAAFPTDRKRESESASGVRRKNRRQNDERVRVSGSRILG